MPPGLNAFGKAARYALSVLMLAAVVGILALQRSSQAAWSQGVHWESAGQRAAHVGARQAAPLRALLPAVPTWSANVRANTDTTGLGQHEPGLAVSPANSNVVVVAAKDWRDSN